jgi:hypothetical protein
MSDRPNFSFHRRPRFSANQLAEYIHAGSASQRETVMRAAKFPRTTAVVAYAASRRIIADFLPNQQEGLLRLASQVARLEVQLRRERDGWMQDELKRNIEALNAFRATYTAKRLRRLKFTGGPTDLSLNLEGVRINTRLDTGIIETDDNGSAFCGGLVLFLASGATSRKKAEERAKLTAAMVHWNLEEQSSNIEPLARLCLCLDVFGGEITKAPTATDRLRANVKSSCREAASNWDKVEPPPSYDGPDWR